MRSPGSILFTALAIFVVITNCQGQDSEGHSWALPLEKCWTYRSPSMTSTPPASDNNLIVALTQTPARLTALSLLTGQPLWTVASGGQMAGRPYFDDDDVLAYSSVENEPGKMSYRLVTVDSLSGIARAASSADVATPLQTFSFDSGLAVLEATGTLKLIGKGGVVWQRVLPPEKYIALSRSGNLLFVSAASGTVFAIDGDTGSIALRFDIPEVPSGAFALASKRIYAGSQDGNVYSLDRESGEIEWTSRTGGTIDEVVAEEDGVIVVSRDNYVYRLSDGNGSRIWKRKLAGRILGSARLGRLYSAFLSYGTNEVAILRMDEGKLVNRFEMTGASYFVGAPVVAGNLLLVPFDSGLAALAPKDACKEKEDGNRMPSSDASV